MTVIESIALFIIVVCAFTCNAIMSKDINDLKYNVNVIREVSLNFAGMVDDNFDIQSAQIEELKGPTYGPMLEDEEE